MTVTIAVWFALLGPVNALVNPEGYTANAPEKLKIEILENKIEKYGSVENIWLRVRVLTVYRSQSGLKAGAEIEISYTRDLDYLAKIEKWLEEKSRQPGWAGDTPPYPPHPPEVGHKVDAYLVLRRNDNQKTYYPAAKQYSFSRH